MTQIKNTVLNKVIQTILVCLCCFVLPSKGEQFKLDSDILPVAQFIDLRLNPNAEQYMGKTTINLTVPQPTKVIKLYAKGLDISDVVIEGANKSVPLKIEGTNAFDIVSLVPNFLEESAVIAAGEYRLKLTFSGRYTQTGSGLFKVSENGEDYLFTQFQSMLARTVFPSFDQPNFKIPFQFNITVPADYLVLSNTPLLSKVLSKKSDGKHATYLFEPTAPIYTDVLAFSVGKFDSIDIPNMPIPSKLYALKGKLPQANFALKHTGAIFEQIETFFAMSYPYKKLDMLAVPSYADGAMENVGLVYFKEDFILLGDTPSIRQQKFSLKLIAHEIAHMWFGNLVTMNWWNDLWLNEAFAEWLGHKVVINGFSELSAELDLPQLRSLSDDNVTSQLPIRREVKSKADADSMGGIAYSKGNAILNMVELYVGENVFRDSVIAYIKMNKNGNATLDDFVRQIEVTSDKSLTGIFTSFLNQPGFPLLTVEQKSESILLSQSPFGNVETNNSRINGESVNAMQWQIPLSIKFMTPDGVISKKVYMQSKTMEVPKPKNTMAVFLDAEAVGYFRYALSAHDEHVIKTNITLLNDKEKLAWLNNNQDLTKVNKRAYVDVFLTKLALLSDLSLNKKIANDLVSDLYYSYTDIIPSELQPDYSRFIAKHLQPVIDGTDWRTYSVSKLASQSLENRALQASLLKFSGTRLNNKQAVVFAYAHYKSVLAGTSDFDLSMIQAILEVVAVNYLEPEYVSFENAYIHTKNNNLKAAILTAMGHFPQPSTVTRYYDFLLSGKVPTDEISYRFQYPSFNPILRDHVIEYIAKNKESILANINQPQWFPYTFYTSCERKVKAKVNQVFSAWVKDVPGLQEKLNVINETITQCIQSREKSLPALKGTLQTVL